MEDKNSTGFRAVLKRLSLAAWAHGRTFARWAGRRLVALYHRVRTSERLQRAWSRTRAFTVGRWRALVRRWDHGAPLRRLMRPLLALARVVAIAVIATGLMWASQALWIHTIPPGEIGVRQVVWGKGGVVERDYAPGFGFALAGRSSWHHVPSGTRLVSFGSTKQGAQHPMLSIATKDGEPLDVAVSVPYRVKPGEAWRLVSDGLRRDYQGLAVAALNRILPQELSKLSASDWSDPEARAAASDRALATLRSELGEIHLEPEAVLLGASVFHPGYEKKMLEKQLQSQTRRTNESIAERARVQLEFQNKQRELASEETRLVAGHDLEIEAFRLQLEEQAIALSRELGTYRSERRLEGDAAVENAKLEGDLALAEAGALGESLTRELFATDGGRLHLAVEAARNLRFGSVKLNSNDPRVPRLLDLDEMVGLLVGTRD